MIEADPRLEPLRWDPAESWRASRRKLRLLAPLNVVAAIWYFTWLLRPGRVGNPILYGFLVAAEVFNLVQAAGFWWTCWGARRRRPVPSWPDPRVAVDVLIPVYNEPVGVVEPTVAAARRLGGADVTVWLLDDANRDDLAALAARHGVRYLRRPHHVGAKAGNLNHALARTTAPFVVVLDCDHVADQRLLDETLGHFVEPDVAFVQTPQYYANADQGRLASAAWSQQALFFGGIARGKDAMGSMFCCGTNVVFRREALAAVGGFPEGSLTEDFELSLRLHEQGWRSVYVPVVLARGLGPEDAASYVSQQQRWARGCLSALPAAARADLPWRLRLQYVLSGLFFLSGWTFLVYMALPAVRLLLGAQPLAGAGADQFLVHFAPYWGLSLAAVAVVGGGSYTFAAFTLLIATSWIHIVASVLSLLGRTGRFVVTPKEGTGRPQPMAVAPALGAMAVLVFAAITGLARDQSPGTLNNVAFAAMHIALLGAGVWPALVPSPAAMPLPALEEVRAA